MMPFLSPQNQPASSGVKPTHFGQQGAASPEIIRANYLGTCDHSSTEPPVGSRQRTSATLRTALNRNSVKHCSTEMPERKTTARRARTSASGGPRTFGRLKAALDDVVRREIAAALNETDGNVAADARDLGVTDMAMRKRLRSFGIDPNDYRK